MSLVSAGKLEIFFKLMNCLSNQGDLRATIRTNLVTAVFGKRSGNLSLNANQSSKLN